MADSRLRQLERSASQGDPQAQVRLLLQRVRVGELSQRELELAAYMHHRPALRALGRDPSSIGDLASWVEGLAPWGRTVCARAAIRATDLIQEPFREWLRLQPAACRDLRGALAAAESWLEEGRDRDRDVASKRYFRFLANAGTTLYGVGPDRTAAMAVSEAVRTLCQDDFEIAAGNAVRHVVKARSPRLVMVQIRRDLLPRVLAGADAVVTRAG